MILKDSSGVRMKIHKLFLRALFFGISLLSLFSLPLSPLAEENQSAPVQEEARKGGYQLIDMDALWQLYQNENDNLVLVDTGQEWEYHAGYIPGALNFPFEPTWLSRLTNRGVLEQFLGPDKNKIFVFY